MLAFLAVILFILFEDAVTQNYVILHCAHDEEINKVRIHKQAGSDTYLLQAECNGMINATEPVEIQSSDFSFPSVDEKIDLFCEEGECFKETIPLEDIVLWPNRTDKTCEGEEETSNLLPVLLSDQISFWRRIGMTDLLRDIILKVLTGH